MVLSRCSIRVRFVSQALGWGLIAGLLISSCAPSPDSRSSNTQTAEPSETTAQSAPDSDLPTNTVIIPGDRVGSVTASTTYDDLVSLYGEDALENTSVHLGEGMFLPGTRVNQGDRSFSVVWIDDSRRDIDSIRDFGSAWQIEPGIGVGTSFADLRTLLGAFELYGFGWDYGGTVVLDGTTLDAYKDELVLRLSPGEGALENSSAYETVLGDQRFPSDTPDLQALNLAVSEMIVMLE